jgi:GTP cyclohydrolase-4
LTRVGVKNLKFGIKISGKSGTLSLFPSVDLFVDLPSDEKGVHLSRNIESLNEVLQEQLKPEIHRIEDFCEIIARRLLEKHKYASTAEVHLRSDYVVSRQPPASEGSGNEPCEILAMATATRKSSRIETHRMVGVKIIGITTCPCAQGILRSLVEERLRKLGYLKNDIKKIISNVPLATHSQRTFGTVFVEVPVGYSIDVEDLIDIVEESMSGRTYSLLKRPSEALIIEAAHKKTKFTEDVVREILWRLAKKYRNFPDGARVFANVYSEESVHKHDIVAERAATLGEIRSEIKV